MFTAKEKEILIIKATEKQKGIKINLNSGEVYSGTTNKPYVNQSASQLIRLFKSNEEYQEIFNSQIYGQKILDFDESMAITYLFYIMRRENFLGSVKFLQALYSAKHDIDYRSLTSLYTEILEDNPTIEMKTLVKYLIDRNIHFVNTRGDYYLQDFVLYQRNIDETLLNKEQKEIIIYFISCNEDDEKIKYLIRKIKSEHIDVILSLDKIKQYFNLCEIYDTPFNQKNMLKSFAELLYRKKEEKEKENFKYICNIQQDCFKMDTEELYCVLPKKLEEFVEMGNMMSNCIGGYYNDVLNGRSRIIFVYERKTNRPVINMELTKNYSLAQWRIETFLGFANSESVYDKYSNFRKDYQEHLKNLFKPKYEKNE